MTAYLGAALLVVIAFAVCDWSGRILARHYQDGLEVAAIFAIGGCVLVGLVLTRGLRAEGGEWPAVVLAVSASAGLFAGYLRSGRAR
jgi:hypothetical protein